ncbi:hypothetical protein Tco_0328737 [Tanacetum coccineum]
MHQSYLSNVIPYEQYLCVDNISVVPSFASSALNDVCVSSDNDVFRMDDQMCMLIQNRNKMEENLKKELHSVKLQLNSTMENNKIIEETVTTLKQEFKQKESKFLTDFSNLKHLNDKLENKLHSQDQSIQTVHMMLNPTQVYDQKTKTALGAQNPFYLRQAKKAQPALYDGEELLKTHHVPVIVSSSEEELELAEATRNKLHVKMNDSACVEKRVVQIVLWYLDSGSSKHMTGDRSQLRNFMKKFIGTVRFENDHFGAIMGYGDYVIDDSVIYWGLKPTLGFLFDFAPNRRFTETLQQSNPTNRWETIHVSHSMTDWANAPVHSSLGPAPHLLMPGPISSGLVPNSAPAIPYVPPTNKDLELLFQLMFDEYFETLKGDHYMPPVPAASTPAISTVHHIISFYYE